MINIPRLAAVPAPLSAGVPLVNAMTAAIALDPQGAGSKASPFTFSNAIYGDQVVKSALIVLQHEKCAYCEGMFRAFTYGDVEHFRPKGYSQQRVGGPLLRPGYYWLAYDWSNLHLSCEPCNRARKRNVFPLRDARTRARMPSDNIGREDPMLLDPSGARDPAQHIRFEGAVPKSLSDVGDITIDLLKLDRITLTAARLRHLTAVDALKKLVLLGDEPGASQNAISYAAEARAQLADMVLPNAQFSAMTRDYLNRH